MITPGALRTRAAETDSGDDAFFLRAAADEIDRLSAEVARLTPNPKRAACRHESGRLILTEVGLARQCNACGFQDFTV